MKKMKISSRTYLYPMPTLLLGADVNGKANFMVVAYSGIVNHYPPMIEVASGKGHYTNIGIKENKTFSINHPSDDMLKVTDYCGLVSGKRVDKSKIFKAFYGELKTAPMIEECPLNLECKLKDTLSYGGNEIFIGEIVEAYSDDRYLTNNLPDISKIKPIIFSMHDNNYWKLGEHLGKAWSIGKDYTK